MGATWSERTPTGAPPREKTQRARRLTFQEKFRWHTRDFRPIQVNMIFGERRVDIGLPTRRNQYTNDEVYTCAEFFSGGLSEMPGLATQADRGPRSRGSDHGNKS